MITLTRMNNFADQKLYVRSSYELHPGLRFLVGRNGAGKSTFLRIVEEYCKENNIKYVSMHEDVERGSNSLARYLNTAGSLSTFATYSMSSEGERIYINLCEKAQDIGAQIARKKKGDKFILIIDGVDSGLDIKMLQEVRSFLHMVEKSCIEQELEYYILITANNYGFIEGEQCLDVKRLSDIRFNSYQEFADFIVNIYKKEEAQQKAKETREKNKKLKEAQEAAKETPFERRRKQTYVGNAKKVAEKCDTCSSTIGTYYGDNENYSLPEEDLDELTKTIQQTNFTCSQNNTHEWRFK